MGEKNFGLKIRKLRSNAGFSMDQFAKRLGVTKGAVNMWENKGVVPREDILIKISKEFNVSIDYLLDNDEMEGLSGDDGKKIGMIYRGLKKMDNQQLEKAENILKVVFDDLFEDKEGDEDDDI